MIIEDLSQIISVIFKLLLCDHTLTVIIKHMIVLDVVHKMSSNMKKDFLEILCGLYALLYLR